MVFIPQDLLKDTSKPDTDKNYFNITITDLEPDESYPIQFAWIYSDRIVGEYSATYTLTTDLETAPLAPEFRPEDAEGGQNYIRLTWTGNNVNGLPYGKNLDRIEVYITDVNNTFGNGSRPAAFFRTAGNFLLTAPAGTYTITLRAYTTRGRISAPSTARTVTVTGTAAVEAPTLATGLSATTAPFGLTVNWNGTYAGDTFEGFKAVRIFASSVDRGSSTTTGITNSNVVGNMSIDQAANRLNVGLDNLRVALGLANNAAAYTTDIWLYYVTTNILNEDYSVGGVITYTRINTTALRPTKANFIDLANGVISIENLVAGNGQFTSWLRTGSAGGGRIELSGVTSSFIPSGESLNVLPGLAVYSTGSTPIFRADLAGNVAFGDYTPDDIEQIEGIATTAATDAADADAKALQALNGLETKLATSGSIIADPITKQLTAINANGVTVYATPSSSSTIPTSGARIIMNSEGIVAYNSSSINNLTGVTFSLSASNGNATFRGTVDASTITGSTFTSTNYPSGSGIAISTGTGGGGAAMLFNVSGTQTANITAVSGGLNVVGLNSNIALASNAIGISAGNGRTLNVGSLAYLDASGGSTAGALGILRNMWASTANPAGGSDGDVWLKYA